MAQRTKPPFRADHVGSLIRPQELRDARQAHLEGRLSVANLRAIEDRLIREVIASQERVGLQAVNDGEFRRTRDALKRRIDEASRVIDLDRLGLCPQCGFATLYRYDRMGLDLQEKKLELLVATARDIWG